MILQEIKNFLSKKEYSDLNEICSCLNHDKEVVKHALNMLIEKEVIHKELLKNPCVGCTCGNSCSEHGKELYKINT